MHAFTFLEDFLGPRVFAFLPLLLYLLILDDNWKYNSKQKERDRDRESGREREREIDKEWNSLDIMFLL